jgi:xylulokinase
MNDDTGCLVGLDIGSTTVRCIVFDLQGRPLSEAYREAQLSHPRPNWTEADPEGWWRAAVTVLREALAPIQERVHGVGLCGLQHAPVLVDEAGRPLAPAPLWMDQRCQPQAEWMAREHGTLLARELGWGRTMSTSATAPKLRWIAEHEPELLERAAHVLLVKDFVRLRLTGTIATDPSDAAGTSLYDGRTGRWSEEMLALAGVPPHKMPPICASTTVAGPLTPQAAEETGLPAGTPVVVGGGDVRCTLIGANTFVPAGSLRAPARACLYLGTAAWLSAGARLGATYDHPPSASFGATATTGATLTWLVSLLEPRAAGDCPSAGMQVPCDAYAALLEQAAGAPLGAGGLLFLPHLMGERGPHYDPQARGTFFGLTLAHGRAEMARAVLEGCALQLRRITMQMDTGLAGAAAWAGGATGSGRDGVLGTLVVVGGGARSPLWRQIIADVTGHTLLVPRVIEAGALGAAILAGVGAGVYPGVPEAAERLVQIESRVEPDPECYKRYTAIYALFRELEDRVAPMYAQVSAL